MTEKRFTSFCGLYCLDCVPSNKRLFETLKEFNKSLEHVNFEKYTALKSEAIPIFKKYPEFLEVLKEIEKLECIGPCRENEDKAICKIRACAIDKKYEGCWECPCFKKCELLEPIKKIHPLLDYNLETIKKFGIDEWSKKRGKHYVWSQDF